MDILASQRAALAAAISEFRLAEAAFVAAEANAIASGGLRSASGIAEAIAAEKVASAAGEAAWGLGQRVVERANEIIIEAAGADVGKVIGDLDNYAAQTVAWREARDRLIREADAALPMAD